MSKPKFPWGDETELALRALWSSGRTASMVAVELQTFGYITRCSVIGKARRLGLESRISGVRHATIKPKRQRPPAPKPRAKSLPFILRPLGKQGPSFAPLPLPTEPVTDVARISYADFIDPSAKVEIPSNACRWPVGEPTQGFCGCPKVEGLSYCETHAHRAFATPQRPSPYPTPNVGITAIRAVEEFMAEAVA